MFFDKLGESPMPPMPDFTMDTCDAAPCPHPFEGMSELPQMFQRIYLKCFRDEEFFDTTKLEQQLGLGNITIGACLMIYFMCAFLLMNFIGTFITIYERLFASQLTRNSSDRNGNTKEKTLQENGISKYKRTSYSNGALKENLSQGKPYTKGNGTVSKKKISKTDWLEKSKTFFNCFCLLTNGRDLLNTSSASGDIPCLHGLRVISQNCVIVCHIFATLFYITIKNFSNHIPVTETWLAHSLTLTIFHAVDSFFLLSGLVNAYSYFQSVAKGKRKSWLYFYVHRFIRLTPIYMIVLGFYTTVFPYLGSSSSWSVYPEKQLCSKYWWRNFLYISNMYPLMDLCMTWSWSLSTDMQFFAISPLFLVTLWKWPKIGFFLLGLFACGSAVINCILTYGFNLPNMLLHIYLYFGQESLLEAFIVRLYNYFNLIYLMPYARISPYIIGLGTAYFLFQWQQKKNPKLSSVALKRGWIMAACLFLYTTFGISRTTKSLIESALYNGINQICFSLALAWIIFVCVNGQGGIINDFLSCKIMIPLGRLTYCAYLIHPVLMMAYAISLKESIEFSYIRMELIDGCLTVGSFVVAFFIYLLFESPFARMEKIFWNKLNY